jgi:N-methylhydantoinase A
MSDLIHRATVERGYDPRPFVLFAVGGAAPVHAGRYAADLGIREVIVPVTASVQGALGLISSDVVHEYGKSDRMEFPGDLHRINDNFATLVERAYRDLRGAGFDDGQITIQRSLDLRYRFQTHELNTPLPPGAQPITDADMEELDALFDALYEQSYGKGSGYREAGKEAITFRVRGAGRLTRPRLLPQPLGPASSTSVRHGSRPVYFEEYDDYVSTDVYRYDAIGPGMEVPGPAVIESPLTTIVVNPTDLARMDEYCNIRLLIGMK